MQSSIHSYYYHNCPLVAYIMPFTCPKNKAEWTAAAKTYNVIGKTLLTWLDLRSGSKVNKEQYLLYRVLLPDCKEPVSRSRTFWVSYDSHHPITKRAI